MENKIYPKLEEMCRLCLKENAGTVNIFPKEKSSEKYAALSIPMRIMTCAALEVQDSDDFPKKICTECRLQLEKSYYFRKQSQASDAKLRKHLRLISMGKTSKVFNKKSDEDDDDELEFQDTLDFIREQENLLKEVEKVKFDNMIKEIRQQNEQEIKRIKENLKIKCREELKPEIREEVKKELVPEIKIQVRNELRIEVENELEEVLRKEISQQCLNEAKESVRNEVYEECRQLEIKNLLCDLESYLTAKKKSLNSDSTDVSNEIVKRIPTTDIGKDDNGKDRGSIQNSNKMQMIEMDIDEINRENIEKGSIILTEQIIETNLNASDEECDSEGNFLIYDTDEGGYEVQKKENTGNESHVEYIVQDYIDSNTTYDEKMNEKDMDSSEMSTTSYRIEDNENGEIHFMKKSGNEIGNEINFVTSHTNEDIMVINIPREMEREFAEQMEELKNVKVKREKTKKSPGKKTISIQPRALDTILAKTYVNPNQRCTDTPKMFKCDGCPMVFSTKPSLERHLRTHRKVEKTGVTYQCPECRIVVSCSSALRRHMYVHSDEKPFACNVCQKSFVQKEILKRHMQTHTGIKPHQCPHCERSFAQRINLTQHINRTHLEEPRIQQHSCHLCPKRFNHASGLSRHLTTHSGVSFQCSECDRTFGDRSSIKRHIISKHGTSAKKESKTP